MKTQIFLLLFLFFGFGSFQSFGQEWEKLGSRAVDYGIDKDVIHVGAHEGNFTKLKIVVRGGAINMHRMIVEYGNGDRDELELKHNFSKASSSRVIDLKGGDRKIKSITFVYDTKNLARHKAILTVFGKH